MNLHNWLALATNTLTDHGITSAATDAKLIAQHVLGLDKAALIAHPDRELKKSELDQLNRHLERRTKFEPMAFILGKKEFFGLDFSTDSRALIPRWESETLVEIGLANLKDTQNKTVIEVGTGSGAIILAVAKHAPNHTFYASDVSPEAVSLAQQNADALGVTNVTWLTGNLGEPFMGANLTGKVDIILANLPYISHELLQTLDNDIAYYEPNLALDGGREGLDYYKSFLPQAKDLLAPGGILACEHDFHHGPAMRQLAESVFPNAKVTIIKDHLGDDRVTLIETT